MSAKIAQKSPSRNESIRFGQNGYLLGIVMREFPENIRTQGLSSNWKVKDEYQTTNVWVKFPFKQMSTSKPVQEAGTTRFIDPGQEMAKRTAVARQKMQSMIVKAEDELRKKPSPVFPQGRLAPLQLAPNSKPDISMCLGVVVAEKEKEKTVSSYIIQRAFLLAQLREQAAKKQAAQLERETISKHSFKSKPTIGTRDSRIITITHALDPIEDCAYPESAHQTSRASSSADENDKFMPGGMAEYLAEEGKLSREITSATSSTVKQDDVSKAINNALKEAQRRHGIPNIQKSPPQTTYATQSKVRRHTVFQ